MNKTKTNKISPRPSQWRVWSKCALSLTFPPPSEFEYTGDTYADEGTLLHAAIEASLKNQKVENALTVEQQAIVNFAVHAAQNEFGHGDFETEKSLKKVVGGVTFAGTADAMQIEDDTIIIVDHKTGWKDVPAENNLQLKIYAHLAATPKAKNWRGVIINARLNTINFTSGVIDPKFLATLAADVKKRVGAKQTKTGEHCTTCPALSICHLVRVAIKKWLEPAATDGIKNRKADWLELLSLAKPAEKLFERVKTDAKTYLELGGKIDGVSISVDAGNRAWPRSFDVAALAAVLDTTVEELTVKKIISPAEAEKAGIDKDKINAIVIRPARQSLKID